MIGIGYVLFSPVPLSCKRIEDLTWPQMYHQLVLAACLCALAASLTVWPVCAMQAT